MKNIQPVKRESNRLRTKSVCDTKELPDDVKDRIQNEFYVAVRYNPCIQKKEEASGTLLSLNVFLEYYNENVGEEQDGEDDDDDDDNDERFNLQDELSQVITFWNSTKFFAAIDWACNHVKTDDKSHETDVYNYIAKKELDKEYIEFPEPSVYDVEKLNRWFAFVDAGSREIQHRDGAHVIVVHPTKEKFVIHSNEVTPAWVRNNLFFDGVQSYICGVFRSSKDAYRWADGKYNRKHDTSNKRRKVEQPQEEEQEQREQEGK